MILVDSCVAGRGEDVPYPAPSLYETLKRRYGVRT